MTVDRLKHHARKAAQRAKETAMRLRKSARSSWWSLLGVVLGVIVILSLLYSNERGNAASQNGTSILDCHTLVFESNRIACEQRLQDIFAALPPIDRAVLCEKEMTFPAQIALCADYDEAIIVNLREKGLEERGVSVWEREPIIKSVGGAIKTKTVAPSTSITLVCDGTLVNETMMDKTDGLSAEIIVSNAVEGECELIAMTNQGSATSEKFNITVD